MGRRLQARRDWLEARTLLRLTLAYLGVFATLVAALSLAAYGLVESNYRSIVAPALDTPEGRAGLSAAMRPALYAILSFDAVVLLVVGLASYALARIALRPLVRAREREERFAADVAHELRTPLAAIASIAQAGRSEATGELATALGTIARRAIECGTLVGDLLTLARNADADGLDREPVDLANVARRAMHEIDLEAPGFTVDADVTSAIVSGDERRLLQLARNLIANARTHARSHVTVRVVCDKGDAVFEVDDDGPGVEPNLVPHLFERFAKGADSHGNGLGLAIVRWVARSHGGDVVFAGGARFVARIPALATVPSLETQS